MPRYIVETEGRVVAAIDSPTAWEAEAFAESMGFLTTLRIITRNGAPLWNGKAAIKVRPMTDTERHKWAVKSSAAENRDNDLSDTVSSQVPFDLD